MRNVKMDCPYCGGPFNMESDNLQCTCPYCGKSIFVDSKNAVNVIKEKEKTKRFNKCIESAERIEIEREKSNRLSKAFNFASSAEGLLTLMLVFSILLILLCAVMESKAKMPISSEEAVGKNYANVVSLMREAGFKNFSIIPDSIKDNCENYIDGDILSISIDGNSEFKAGKKYSTGSSIKICIYAENNEIKLPVSSKSVEGQNYRDIISLLKSYGFTNIQTEKVTGLKGLFKEDNSIVSMTVNGKKKFKDGDKYEPDVAIVISYHPA